MPEEYKAINTSDGEAWIRPSKLAALREVDAVVFDCDGVLVDTRRSYDAAIAEVTDRLLSRIGVRLPWKKFAPSLILQLRRTGGFNNDWDTVYALILFSILALSESQARKIAEPSLAQTGGNPKPILSSRQMKAVTARIAAVTESFCSTDDFEASESVNRFVQDNIVSPVYASAISRVQEWLGYPGSPPTSLLSTIFDEVYHGARLFRRMYGVRPRYHHGRGLIENERILVGGGDLEAVTQLVGAGRLALATGRPYLAAKYVLRDLMGSINRKASVFVGDMDVHPELATQLAQFRKPRGLGLIHARRTLSSETLLYVGDSAEDIKMTAEANRAKERVLFAGIYGTSLDGKEQSRFFRECNADLILPAARQIPLILALVKS